MNQDVVCGKYQYLVTATIIMSLKSQDENLHF